MRYKRFTAVLIALLMLLVPLTAMAEEVADPDFLLEVKSVNAELTAGDTVRVEVQASANKGYAYGSAKFSWDSDALELTDVEYTDAAPDNGSSEIENSGEYTVRFGSYSADENLTKTGTFFTLVFEISSSAEAKSYDIAFDDLSVFDVNDKNVESYKIAGRVNLSAYTDSGLALAADKVSVNLSDGVVKVPVKATENSGYKTASVFTSWDSSALTLDRIEYTSAAPDNGTAVGTSAGSCLVKIGKDTAASDFKSTGTLFTLVFSVNSNAAGGTYLVILSAAFAGNQKGENVKTTLTSGSVKLIDDSEVYVETHVRPTEPEEPTSAPDTTPVDDPAYYGKVGDCTWRFYPASGTLVISGDGAMANYPGSGSAPYSAHSEKIKKVIVSSGVTEIGDYCFAGLTALEEVSMTSSVNRIGTSAFEDSAVKSITIPPSVTEIGEYAVGYTTNGYDGENEPIHEKTADVEIKCELGSEAEAFASENGLNVTNTVFVEPTEPNITEPIPTLPIETEPTIPTTPTECEHENSDYEYVLPDISKGTEGNIRVTCKNCDFEHNIPLSCPEIKLSKTKYTYTGKALKPTVKFTVDGIAVPAESDGNKIYTVKYSDNKNAGTASVKVTMVGGGIAVGSKTLKFTIVKAKNPITVKAVTKSAKLKTVRKKNVTVKGAVKVTKAQGKLSYKISSAPKAIKKYLKISSKGAITIKKWKKAKKATYKIKITATAKGTANYNKKSVTKTVTLKIK